MNTMLIPIFTDSTAEYSNLQLDTPGIDFTDSPCSPPLCPVLVNSPKFLVTAPVPQTGYYEVQYMLANNFWGCNFQFGNAGCGVEIRQGIAHMMDKSAFTNNDANIAGVSTPIDNPVPTTSAGGLLSPNPCGYDTIQLQMGANCLVGAPGGTAYHAGPAGGANGIPWLYAPGSVDLNLAAQHFVNAGVAGGFVAATSVLAGITPAAAANPVTFFIISNDPARLDLGNSLSGQICYLFTGAYATPCPFLNVVRGPLSAFPGLVTSPTSVSLSWWMYTAAYTSVPFFDNSLYFSYNSRLVSASCASPGTAACTTQQIGGGFCSNQSVSTYDASDYMYLCSSNYDSLSSQMESAPCLTAPGDPVAGAASNLPTAPGNGLCNASQLSAHSAGIQAEAQFGASAFTLPIFERSVQFGYLNGWTRVINHANVGLPNFFTWLDTYNPNPAVAGTIRQGFSDPTKSVNPYIARTPQDIYVVRNVYDSLYASDPLAPAQVFNWMSEGGTLQLDNAAVTSTRGYNPPPGTLSTWEFTWPLNVYFQDQRQVTVYDVAFSYLSMVASGAVMGDGASSITGITILSTHTFDIGVSSMGPFVLPNLTTVPIVPGRYWTNAGSAAWDNAANKCTQLGQCSRSQYTLSGSSVNCTLDDCTDFSAGLMTVNPARTIASFDPIANNIFVGSGPWQCGTVTSSGSGSCTSTGFQNPPVGGAYTLTRYGAGLAPASSTSGIYFRSSGDLATFIWACGGGFININCFSAVSVCFQQPVGFCPHYQQGIGGSPNGIVGIIQESYFLEHFNNYWVAPFDWPSNPPPGIGGVNPNPAPPFPQYCTTEPYGQFCPPVLYEGPSTLSPANVVGCATQYPAGGYDC